MVEVFLVFFALIVVLILALVVWQWRRERARRHALQALASQEGWWYLERDRDDRPRRYHGFEPFGQGHSRYAANVLTGSLESVAFELFDYHYAVTQSNGKTTSTQHYHFRVAALQMPLDGADLSIQDEHLGHKLWDAVGGEDIDFESAEFSKRFWVKARDRRFAYDVLHPRLMEWLLDRKGWTWQWRGRTLMLHRKGKLHPSECKPMLELVATFRGHVPRHLLAGNPLPAGAPKRT